MKLEEIIRQIVRDEIRNVQTGGVTPESMRVEAGLTREQLAEKSGISNATVARIEAGTSRHIKTRTLQQIAKAIGSQDYIRVALAARRM